MIYVLRLIDEVHSQGYFFTSQPVSHSLEPSILPPTPPPTLPVSQNEDEIKDSARSENQDELVLPPPSLATRVRFYFLINLFMINYIVKYCEK